MRKTIVFVSLFVLLLSGCGQKATQQSNDSVKNKVSQKSKQKVIVKKVSKEVYPDVDKIEASPLWQNDDQIIKKYSEFAKAFLINPNLKEKDIQKISENGEVPYGIFVGNWESESGSIKNVRIDLRSKFVNPILSEEEKIELNFNFFADDGYNYSSQYVVNQDSPTFNLEKGFSITMNDVEDAINVTLKDGQLVLSKTNEFGLNILKKPVTLKYQGIHNEGEKMTDLDSILTKVKQPIAESDFSIEKHKDANLGIFLVYSRPFLTEGKELEFSLKDVLAYQIDPNKQIAKFFQIDQNNKEKVTYVYKTPINNYQVITAWGKTEGDKKENADPFKVSFQTENIKLKENADSLFFENGQADIFQSKGKNKDKSISDLSDEELNQKLLHLYFEKEGISDSPFKKSLYGIVSKEKASGQIIQMHRLQPQTHIVLNYKLDNNGIVHTDIESKLDNQSIFDVKEDKPAIVSTAEEAMALLQSKEWIGTDNGTEAKLKVTDELFTMSRSQMDGVHLSIKDMELVAPDHLVLKGKRIVEDAEYHVYFYQDGSIGLGFGILADQPSDEDELTVLKPNR